MTTTTRPTAPPVATSAAVLGLIDRGRDGLLEACHAPSAAQRYELAHVAALRIAAAVLAARRPPGRRRPTDVWSQLPRVAPELTEWATFFAGTARVRRGLASGRSTVTVRDGDDLVRQGEMFLERVLAAVGLPVRASVTTCVTPVTPGPASRRAGHKTT